MVIHWQQIFSRAKVTLQNLIGFFQYHCTLPKRYYPYQLVGEKKNLSDTSKTTILFRVIGKRDIFEMPIHEILEKSEIIEKFHPKDTIKFGAIAMGDTLFREPNEDLRKGKFLQIKQQMLDG